MRRVHARGVVAGVQYPHPFRDGAEVHPPRNPMSRVGRGVLDGVDTVVIRSPTGCPLPTIVWATNIHLRPKPLLRWLARSGVHPRTHPSNDEIHHISFS